FQAEDGIRDGHVTGVQTCALPISSIAQVHRASRSTLKRRSMCGRSTLTATARSPPAVAIEARCTCAIEAAATGAPNDLKTSLRRSEERRVGKECRCRGGQRHEQEE